MGVIQHYYIEGNSPCFLQSMIKSPDKQKAPSLSNQMFTVNSITYQKCFFPGKLLEASNKQSVKLNFPDTWPPGETD